MNLIDVVLELVRQFSLVPTEKQRQLRKDCEDWEGNATEDSEDKIKALYAKIHKGILLRLLTPFLLFYLRKEFSNLETKEENPF